VNLDDMREYLSHPLAHVLLTELDRHRERADQEVLRKAQAKEYDPMEVRFRAGIATGMGLILNAIDELRKKD